MMRPVETLPAECTRDPIDFLTPTGRHMEGSLSFSDKTLTCRDCSAQFTFTAGEQEFYASKGLTNEPVRCPSCRTVRKASRVNSDVDDNGGYVKYGTFASFGGRTPRQMHPATCAECG